MPNMHQVLNIVYTLVIPVLALSPSFWLTPCTYN
jgi:hypothetical protein